MSDEVDFLQADKHESFLQIHAMTFGGDGQAFPKFPNSKFAMSLQYLKKEVRDEVEFLHVDKHQSFLQGGFNTWGIIISYKSTLMGMLKHSQSMQSNKFALCIKYLWKEVRDGVYFLLTDKH